MATIRWKQLYREFEDGGNFTGSFIVSGSMKATGSVSLTGSGAGNLLDTLDVNGRATLRTAAVENLTQGRVVLVGSGSLLEDTDLLTFSGSFLNISNSFSVNGETGDVYIGGDLTVAGGDIYTSNTTGSLFITTAKLINIGNEAERITLGQSGSVLEVNGDIQIDGGLVNSTTGQTVLILSGSDGVFANNLVVNNDLFVSGNLTLLGNATEVIISSSTVEIDDNIIRLNAFFPYERYSGIEVVDSGSNLTSASLLWDSLQDYWIVQNSTGQTGTVLSTTPSNIGAEVTLTQNYIPKASGTTSVENSLLLQSGSTLSFDGDTFTISEEGNITIKNNLVINGLASSSFIVVGGGKEIISITPNNSGDITQWDGANFISSNVIDGGTF